VTCPVCLGKDIVEFARVDEKTYWRCERCEACFLDRNQLPSPQEEHAHYLHHQNNVDDINYRNFLQKAATPLLKKLAPHCHGLDYGCGSGPALAAILSEAGHGVSIYDPFFQNNPRVLNSCYDFITCTETAEHFHRPATEFDRFSKILKPRGWLAIMTSFLDNDTRFTTWHYRRDPTHVVFYRKATFQWLANHHNWSCDFPAKDVALMQNNSDGTKDSCPYNEI